MYAPTFVFSEECTMFTALAMHALLTC